MDTQIILKSLKEAWRATDFILEIFMGGNYYQGTKKGAFYQTMPVFSKREIIKTDSKFLKKEKQKFYSSLSRLKRQGFVSKKIKDNKTFWKITALGEKRLEKINNIFHFPKLNYKQEKSNDVVLIIFDIPEKERNKRAWLRSNLSALGFTLFQKSVWMGKNKLPEEFLKALSGLNLINYIHILKITKTGTIKELNF